MPDCPIIDPNEECLPVEQLGQKISLKSAKWMKRLLSSGAKSIVFYQEGDELKACYYFDDEAQ